MAPVAKAFIAAVQLSDDRGKMPYRRVKPEAPRDGWGHVAGDPHHNFLRTTQWQRIRLAFLTRHPLCEHCTLLGVTTPATQADHIVRLVDNDHFRRTSWAGLQALCAGCHARKSKWERGSQRRPLRLGTDRDGYPIELKHGFVETPERLAFLASA